MANEKPKRRVVVEYNGETISFTNAEALKRQARKALLWVLVMAVSLVLLSPPQPKYAVWVFTHFKIFQVAAIVALGLGLWKAYSAGCSDAYQLGWNEGQNFMDAMQAKEKER